MSTSYHALPSDVTGLTITYECKDPAVVLTFSDGGHVRMEGDLSRIRLLLRSLARELGDFAARRSNGQITVTHPGRDSHWVVSDYGELATLGDLREGRAP